MTKSYLAILTEMMEEAEKEYEETKKEVESPKIYQNPDKFEIFYRRECAKKRLEMLRSIKRLPEYLAFKNIPRSEYPEYMTEEQIKEIDEINDLHYEYSREGHGFDNNVFYPVVDDPKKAVKLAKTLASYKKTKIEIKNNPNKTPEEKERVLRTLAESAQYLAPKEVVEVYPAIIDHLDIESSITYNLSRIAEAKARKDYGVIFRKVRDEGIINSNSGFKM